MALFAACSTYQAGTGTQLPFASIQVAPVENLALAPQAHDLMSSELRRALNQNAELALVNSDAEAELQVVLTNFRREVAATRGEDTVLARKYTLYLSLEASLLKEDGQSYWFKDRPYEVSLDVFLDSGQPQAERQGMVLLCQKAADTIASGILQTW